MLEGAGVPLNPLPARCHGYAAAPATGFQITEMNHIMKANGSK